MWSEKYRIKEIDDFIGNEQSRLDVIKWSKNWIKGMKPLLIMGPPGTGKTSFVISLAKYFNYDLVELNASDFRNKGNLDLIVNPLMMNNSIFGKKLLLFFDEVDGISGRDDTGGLPYLISVLKNSSIPIIMAANSKNSKIKEVIKNSKTIEFKSLSPFDCYLLLQRLLFKEGRSLKKIEKLELIEKSDGDIRTLLNLLQAKVDGEYDSLKFANRVISMEESINLFFTVVDSSELKTILYRSDLLYMSPKFGASPDERARDIVSALFSSIMANEKKIPIETMAKILASLSEFDLYVNKIFENRNWRLLRYANDILISKLFDITRGLPIKYNQYSIPFPLIGSIFIRGQSTRLLGKSLSKNFHTSSSEFGLFYYLPLLLILKDFSSDIFFNTSDDSKLNEILIKEKDRLRKR